MSARSAFRIVDISRYDMPETKRGEKRKQLFQRICFAAALLFVVHAQFVFAAENTPVSDAKLAAIFAGGVPSNVNELRAMQEHTRKLAERVSAATVAIQVGSAQGSGVIVNPEGYVLTAAHVIGRSGQLASVNLHDGRRVVARTLGSCRTLDAGLIKLERSPGKNEAWPYIPMGDSSGITLGQWCLATGHPGGIQNSREPSLRLGRILSLNPGSTITTDCTLIGGDSGGPLFDMQGKVVAIHSRIGGQLTANLHVPVNAFRESWDRMQKGENWGHTPGNQPFLGVQGEKDATDAKISRVFPESPALQAGIREGDVVVRFAGHSISDFDSLRGYVDEQEPGTKVPVEVMRGDKRVALEVVVGRIRE